MNKALAASERPLEIAVIGSGISGLAAAWLLSRRHRVTLFEADGRVGGHSHTVDAGKQPVDTGFIVYNEATYPNLAALFNHIGAPTKPAEMTFAVSLDAGRLEYSGTDFAGLFAQRRNLVSLRFWTMLAELVRFYRRAANDVAGLGMISLDEYLDRQGFGEATALRIGLVQRQRQRGWSRIAEWRGACRGEITQNIQADRAARPSQRVAGRRDALVQAECIGVAVVQGEGEEVG